jgi:predicted porin
MLRPLAPRFLAALAAVALAPSESYAQPANVSIYGRLNMDVEVVNGRQSDGSNPKVTRVSSNSSAFGFRGSEYLGDGIVAVFQIESAIQADVSGLDVASRETYVGLDGPWGQVKLGYFLGPYDDVHPIFGNVPTLTTSILSTAAVWAQGFAAKNVGGFDARMPNSIRYDSPDLSGLSASVQASLGEGVDYPGTLHAYVLSSGVFYTNGPLQLGMGYERNNGVRANPIPGGQPLNDYAFSVSGAYDFGPVRLGAIYEYLDYDTPQSDGGRYSLTRGFWGVSATIPAGPGVVYAFYGQAGDGKGSAPPLTRVAGLAKGPETGAKQWEVSYTYPMSKRTLLYGGYVMIDNGANASYTFANNPYTTAIGGKPAGFIMGMAHFF